MYWKMQESGLIEVIPLIGTSAIWGQYPVFSHPELPQGSPAHGGRLQSLMTITPLLIDMAENIPFLTVNMQ